MKKVLNIFTFIVFIVLLSSLSIVANKYIKVKPKVVASIEADKSEYEVRDDVKIDVSLENTGKEPISNVAININVPDEMRLKTSSPDITRTRNLLNAGESVDTFALMKVTSEPEKQVAEVASENIFQTAIRFYCEAAIIIAISAFCILILLFILRKKARVATGLLLVLVLSLGAASPFLIDLALKLDTNKEIQVSGIIKIDDKEVPIVGTITYSTKADVTEVSANNIVAFDTSVSADAIIVEEGKTKRNVKAAEINSQLVDDGENAEVPDRPVLEGYVFAGWFVDEDYEVEFDLYNTPITENLYLHARWVDERSGWDSDGDGISDYDEKIYGSDPYTADDIESDSDGDGISDYKELFVYKTDPNNKDTDGDKLTDYYEIAMLHTDPTKLDSDGDGTSDYDADFDEDGLTNGEEQFYKTNPLLADSDRDRIDDLSEINETLTDPIKLDSDGDGASDGWEIANGYDPLVKDESFEVKATAFTSNSNVTASVQLSYKGNPDSVKVKESQYSKVFEESLAGYMGCAYDFSADSEFESAQLQFDYSAANVGAGAKPVICYFNTETQMLEPLETEIRGGVATATVTHFSTYILLDGKPFDEVWENRILSPDSQEYQNSVFDMVFVIDYSGSMKSNDPDRLRMSIVSKFIDHLRDGKDRAALVAFAIDADVMTSLNSNMQGNKTVVGDMPNVTPNSSRDGTDGTNGLKAALDELDANSDDNNFKYIIFLTDGVDTRNVYKYDKVIQRAKEKNIVIYTIGMGNVEEKVLTKLADETGGEFYLASAINIADGSDADLSNAFYDIQISTVDMESDSNNDGISDYYTKLICEGKLRTGTGMPVFEGVSFEEIQANADYDGDGLLNGQEVIIKYDESLNRTYAIVLSSPTEKDSDGDGIPDGEDSVPLKNGVEGGVEGLDMRNINGVRYVY